MMTNKKKLEGMGLLEMFLKNSHRALEENTLLSGEIRISFTWYDSPEGHDFWSGMYDLLREADL